MDKKTIKIYDQQVKAYTDLVGDQASDPNLQRFIELIEPNGMVLDLGCGPGISSSVMKQHGLQVDAIDASEQMVLQANRSFNVNARQAEFIDITGEDVYHGIWANFSLLHCSKEEFEETVPRLVAALKHGGVFHMGMKIGKGAKRDSIGRFYTYYSEQELQDSCTQNGLSILNVVNGQGPGLSGDIEPWIIFLAKK